MEGIDGDISLLHSYSKGVYFSERRGETRVSETPRKTISVPITSFQTGTDTDVFT